MSDVFTGKMHNLMKFYLFSNILFHSQNDTTLLKQYNVSDKEKIYNNDAIQ